MIIEENSNLRQKVTRADIEIASLRQENEQLHMDIGQLKQILESVPPVPKYGDLQDRGLLQNTQYPWDKSRSPELGFVSQSVHVEIIKLKDELEATKTQLRKTQTQLQQTQTQLKTQAELQVGPNSDKQMLIKAKKKCKDNRTKKVCEKLKNKGKGCKKTSTRKTCKKTCGLCFDGKSH